MFGPNITGAFCDLLASEQSSTNSMGTAFGSFSVGGMPNNTIVEKGVVASSVSNALEGIQFNASRGKAIYGGTTLQPKALQALACIRY